MKKTRMIGNPVPEGTLRIKKYSLNEIFDFMRINPDKDYYVDQEGNRCKLRRAKVFLEKGISCVETGCLLKGEFFALEKWPDGSIHFDLYSYDEQFKLEVLMTIDHIFPKSKGGKDKIENYQPMCCAHNYIKSDNV